MGLTFTGEISGDVIVGAALSSAGLVAAFVWGAVSDLTNRHELIAFIEPSKDGTSPKPLALYETLLGKCQLLLERWFGASLWNLRSLRTCFIVAFCYSIFSIFLATSFTSADLTEQCSTYEPFYVTELFKYINTINSLRVASTLFFSSFFYNLTKDITGIGCSKIKKVQKAYVYWICFFFFYALLFLVLYLIYYSINEIILFILFLITKIAFAGVLSLMVGFPLGVFGGLVGVKRTLGLLLGLIFFSIVFLIFYAIFTVSDTKSQDFLAGIFALINFLTIFPLANAVFDMASWIATRFLIQKLKNDASKVKLTNLALHLLADITIAGCLSFGLIFSIFFIFNISFEIKISLEGDLWKEDPLSTNLFFTSCLLTTIIPTLVHLTAGLLALGVAFPVPCKSFVLRQLNRTDELDFARATFLTTLITTRMVVPLLLIMLLLYIILYWLPLSHGQSIYTWLVVTARDTALAVSR